LFSEVKEPAKRDPDSLLDLFKTRKGKVAYAIGANFGNMSQILLTNFDQVFAFEPAFESFVELVQNVSDPRFVPLNLAVSDADGLIELKVQSEHIKSGQKRLLPPTTPGG
jgi:FkbM family methyltransferase